MRIGVVREFMVKHTKNDVAISDQIDKEIKTVLRDKLGAELVESVDPLYPDDPAIPNLKYTFQDAFAEILPHTVPEYFWQKTRSGELEFAVPGWDVTTVDYAVALATGKAPLSPKLNLRRIAKGLANPAEPLRHRTSTWSSAATRASRTGRAGWPTRSSRAMADALGAQNADRDQDHARTPGSVSYLKMQSVLRMIVLKVMYENGIDVFVNPEQTTAALQAGMPRRTGGQRSAHDQLLPTVHGADRRARDGRAGRLHPDRLRAQYVLSARQEELRRGHRHSRVEAAAPDADQHDVLGGPGNDRGDQGRVGLRGGDASPQAAAGVRSGAGQDRRRRPRP